MLKKYLFYLFYISCSFTFVVCGRTNILPYFTNSRAACFWTLGAGAA